MPATLAIFSAGWATISQFRAPYTLGLYKMHSGVYDLLGSAVPIIYDSSTLYTLTLEFSGSTITGYFEGTSVSYTDDGTTYGAVIDTGNIGFGGDALTLGYYDDALVIEN